MANKMYHRNLSYEYQSPSGEKYHVVDTSQLGSFQADAVITINHLIDHVNNLHRKATQFEKAIAFADWVAKVYPEIIDNYKTSERVAKRIDGDTPQEVCESAS